MTEGFFIEDGVLLSYTGRDEMIIVPKGVHTIGKEAFKACVSLKKVELPTGLQCIRAGAFKGCRKLEEVKLPDTVCEVGAYVFHRCHSLREISLPLSVRALEDCAFLYCDSLKEVRIPGVIVIKKQAFVNDVRLERIEISKDLQKECICDVFTGCGSLSDISFADGEHWQFSNAVEAAEAGNCVPELVRAIAVDILRMMELNGRCLVKFLTNLKHVEILEGIEKIGKSCFFDKRGILSVKFPKTLREIESRAFRNCINLETVHFQSESVRIHEDAFKNCTSLKQIQMPGGACFRLEGIGDISEKGFPELVRMIHSQVLGNFRISGTILLKYLGYESRVVVPEGITALAEEAFAGKESIDRILLPESLRRIGAEAFKDCLLLQTISLPPGIEYIGPSAFENCVKLIRVFLPPDLTKVEKGTFKRCQVLKEVSFGRDIQVIEEQAFYGCGALKEMSLPESLTFIGEMAFYRCRGLERIDLPDSVETVKSLAFAECGVKKAKIRRTGRSWGNGVFFGCKRLKKIELEDGVVHIPDRFAYGCISLHEISVPDTILSVGRNVWEDTPFLENWLQKGQETEQKILWDGRNLSGCVRLSAKTRVVAGGAFYGNTKITQIDLSGACQVGAAAFKGCSRLTQVVWPSALHRAEEEVFAGCTALERVTGPSEADIHWQSVEKHAFYLCRKLRALCLDQVKTVGEGAFEDTDFLSLSEDGLSVAGDIVLQANASEGEIRLPEGIRKIAPFAFAGNVKITKVVFPASLESVGEGAFFGCRNLSEVSFQNHLCVLGPRAFEKCMSLRQIDLDTDRAGAAAFAYCISLEKAALHKVKVLEERLFEGCKGLEICICEGAREVKDFCFSGCGRLKEFDLQKVRVVGARAFSGCDSLACVTFSDDTCIHAHAFEDCGRLKVVCIKGSKGILHLREYAFSGCTALTCVAERGQKWEFCTYSDICSERLSQTARLIFHSAFSCFEIEKQEILCAYHGAGKYIKIPDGIRRIAPEVFRDILMLEEVEIPKSVMYIGARAFHGTAWLERLRQRCPMVIVNGMLLDGSACQGEVTVPEHISLVCGWAFAGGMNIKKIRFLSDRVRVGEYAFRNCICLEEILLPDGTSVRITGIEDRKKDLPALAKQAVMDSLNCFKTGEDGVLTECTGNIAKLKVAEGITAIGDGAFQDGNLLTEIIFPSTVKIIGKNAFSGCKWLKEVHRAESVEQIESQAFSGCGQLRRIRLSDACWKIGARAFENCTSLEEILLPEGIEEIPDKAFYRCHSLQNVVLPSTVRRIGKEAFAFCRRLKKVQMPEGTRIEERAFVGCGGEEGCVIGNWEVQD